VWVLVAAACGTMPPDDGHGPTDHPRIVGPEIPPQARSRGGPFDALTVETPAPATDTALTHAAAPSAQSPSDAALLHEARTALESGDLEGMKRAALLLVRDHPTSPLVPHAYLLFGDHLFGQGRMPDAAAFYQRAAAFPDSDVAPYAHYKIAWCHLDQGDEVAALEAFVQASRIARQSGTDEGTRLARSAVRDSALPFATVGRIDRAADFYARLVADPVELEEVLAHLTDTLIAEGRIEELAEACVRLGSPTWCAPATW
jgi:tetratricopeptide (TPR) repeat protein